MNYFNREKLDVYRVAIQLNVLIDKVVKMAQGPYQIQSGTGTHTGTGTKLATP
jgi:hypothetical protein